MASHQLRGGGRNLPRFFSFLSLCASICASLELLFFASSLHEKVDETALPAAGVPSMLGPLSCSTDAINDQTGGYQIARKRTANGVRASINQ
ncbi:hypothetical protein ACQKWADRAFT_285819 [Trichoderma austrokoningii]